MHNIIMKGQSLRSRHIFVIYAILDTLQTDVTLNHALGSFIQQTLQQIRPFCNYGVYLYYVSTVNQNIINFQNQIMKPSRRNLQPCSYRSHLQQSAYKQDVEEYVS